MRSIGLLIILLLISPTIASGHEFWISPEKYQVADGEVLSADIRVGQNFEGRAFAFIPAQFDRFSLVQGDREVAVTSRIGDRPAMAQPLPGPGLWTIVHETRDQRLTYQDAETFEEFVRHKDLDDTLAVHAARGLPAFGFSELYRRFAKSLVASGTPGGQDITVGLRTEIVAETNPYAPDFDGIMRVLVLFEGAPRIDEQVEIYDRAPDGTVSVSTVRTDAQGRAMAPVSRGHEYLFDAVKMVPLDAQNVEAGAVWQSLWASLTFRVPD